MKKSNTADYVEVIYRVPKRYLKKLKKIMTSYGAEEEVISVPWRKVYPNFNPGTALRGARYRENLTQEKLAKMLGISQTHISEMESAKRPIGKEMAKRLSEVLHVDYRVFL